MKKPLLILTMAGLFIAGGVTGGYVASKMQTTTNTSTASSPQTNTPASNRAIDKVSGFNMTPPDMADELQTLPSSADFGWRYANYIIMIRNNEIAMARQAQDKATQPEIKQLAQEQIDANKKVVDQLYALMREAGMSH